MRSGEFLGLGTGTAPWPVGWRALEAWHWSGGGCQAEGGAGPRCAFVWVGPVPGVWDGPGPLCQRVCLGEEPAVCTPAECLLPLTNRLPLCCCCQV